jgi:hypothetical protein
MLLAGDAGPLTDTQEHFLEVVHRNSDRLQRLAGDLLLLARSETGELALDLFPTDIAAVVRDAAEAVRPPPRDLAGRRDRGAAAGVRAVLPRARRARGGRSEGHGGTIAVESREGYGGELQGLAAVRAMTSLDGR